MITITKTPNADTRTATKPMDRETLLANSMEHIKHVRMGLDFVGCEIDKDYFEAQEKRWEHHISQMRIEI